LFIVRRLFHLIVSVGQLPQAWKWASATSVFKDGIASDASNYRSISLTSVFSKLMGRVIVLRMLHYCRQQGLISKQQFGFLAKKSTVTNMLNCMNATCSLMNKLSVAIAYIDFYKAFDTVCHVKLFCKLKPNSITLAGLKLVRSWSQTGSKPNSITLSGSNQLRISSEPASVMEFGFYSPWVSPELKWLENFPCDRWQRTRAGDRLSESSTRAQQ